MPDAPLIRLGHSPDPDDAFMWWPLLEPARIETGPFRFETVTDDIESLNRRSVAAELEITAMSCAQYPAVREQYAITACGASMGDDYGPRVIATTPGRFDELAGANPRVAIPGVRTSAFATLNLAMNGLPFEPVETPFEQIVDVVAAGSCDAGVVIHEGQLTFQDAGLHLLLDLGAWWHERTGLPLPLGLNTIRRDLDDVHGPGTIDRITAMLAASVRYALDHRDESIRYALGFARGLAWEQADRFIEMYVNRWTLDFGERGCEAIVRFLGELHERGFVADPGPIDAVGGGSRL